MKVNFLSFLNIGFSKIDAMHRQEMTVRPNPKGLPRHEICPLCSSKELRHKFTVSEFDLVHCQKCSLVFVLQRLTEGQLATFYQSSDPVYEDPANIKNLDYYFEKLRSILDGERPSGGRLLDIGCSQGQFLDRMAGWDRYGIELSASDSAVARRKHGTRIHEGTLESYKEPSQCFDVITMLDSFDHMPNPREVLARCRSLLSRNGLLVIKVHDISCLWAKISGAGFYAILPPYHLFYYSDFTLRRAMVEAGFEPVMSKHIGHRLFLKTVPYRLSRGDSESLYFKLYRFLEGSRLGTVPVYKNLHDIITVIARRS